MEGRSSRTADRALPRGRRRTPQPRTMWYMKKDALAFSFNVGSIWLTAERGTLFRGAPVVQASEPRANLSQLYEFSYKVVVFYNPEVPSSRRHNDTSWNVSFTNSVNSITPRSAAVLNASVLTASNPYIIILGINLWSYICSLDILCEAALKCAFHSTWLHNSYTNIKTFFSSSLLLLKK